MFITILTNPKFSQSNNKTEKEIYSRKTSMKLNKKTGFLSVQ